MNNAANDDDIVSGTSYANKIGIQVTSPKWGLSRDRYEFDREKNVIAKGLSSVKYLSAAVANELYELSKAKHYTYFTDLLADLSQTSIDTRQLDILIKIDFFSEFGNQRELLRITDLFYDTFNKGQAKKLLRSKIEGTPLEPIVAKYAVGTTKAGGEAKSYTLLDVASILREAEDAIKAAGLEDLSDILKVQNFADAMGYVGYISGKQEDRPKLYVMDVFPLARKKDGKVFGQSVVTKSIGSGIETRFTVFSRVFDKDPIAKGEIIYCTGYEREGKYFRMTGYHKVI